MRVPPVSDAAHQKCVAEDEEATPSATRREEIENGSYRMRLSESPSKNGWPSCATLSVAASI